MNETSALFASLLAAVRLMERRQPSKPYEKVPVVDLTGLQGRFDFALVMRQE